MQTAHWSTVWAVSLELWRREREMEWGYGLVLGWSTWTRKVIIGILNGLCFSIQIGDSSSASRMEIGKGIMPLKQ